VIKDIRIALGSVAPQPIRARHVEYSLRNLELKDTEIRKAITLLDEEISPITDVRSTAEYRRYISKILVYDALQTAYMRLKGEIHG